MKLQLGMTIKGAMALCPGPWQPVRKSVLSPSCIFGKQQRYSRLLIVRFFAANTTGDETSDGGADSASRSNNKTKRTDIPLVFVHGMKGAHLASTATGRRHWATLGALLNILPRKDGDVNRNLSMPLMYTTSKDGVPKQDTGLLEPDGQKITSRVVGVPNLYRKLQKSAAARYLQEGASRESPRGKVLYEGLGGHRISSMPSLDGGSFLFTA